MWAGRHRFLLWVIALHVVGLTAFGLARGWGPAASLTEGSLIAAMGLLAAWPALSRRANSCAAALALALSSIVLIQFSGGRTEAHFHAFIVLAFIALYQEWMPFLVGVLYVGFGLMAAAAIEPTWVYSSPDALAHPWTWGLIELVALLGESVALTALWTGTEHLRTRSDVVLESAGEAVLGLARHGQVTFANPAAGKLFGCRPHQLIGRDVRALMRGLPVTLAGSDGTTLQGDLPRLDGRKVPVEWTLSPKVRAGATIGWVIILRDITSRRDLERQLEVRTRQQAVVAALGSEVLLSPSLDDFLTRVAREVADALDVEFCKVLELAPDHKSFLLRAGVGWHPALLGTARVPADLHSQAGYTLRQDGPVVVEDLRTETRFTGATLLQDHLVVSGMSILLKVRDGPFGVLGAHTTRHRRFTSDDIHFLESVGNLVSSAIERHRADEELRLHRANLEDLVASRTRALTEANRELEAFSYTVSHDLRSPLRSIDGFSRILLDRHRDELPDDSKELLVLLSAGAIRMGNLIESVLSLTRISRVQLADEPLDLSVLVQEILAGLRARDPHRRVKWSIEPRLLAHGDPGLVRLALENLCANAWKFTSRADPGHIVFRRVQGGATPVFVIEDNGAGFDMAHAKDLFQPFHRLHEPSQFQGTGIGLATVSRVVRRHGGTVWARAEVGKGASFFFTLEAGDIPDALLVTAASETPPASTAPVVENVTVRQG